jgi:hypothetical protein
LWRLGGHRYAFGSGINTPGIDLARLWIASSLRTSQAGNEEWEEAR